VSIQFTSSKAPADLAAAAGRHLSDTGWSQTQAGGYTSGTGQFEMRWQKTLANGTSAGAWLYGDSGTWQLDAFAPPLGTPVPACDG
jgi:hypothetical protein